MIRAFVALPLPDAVRARLAMAQFLLPLPRKLPPDSLHITLAFLGDQPDPVLEEVHLALSALHLPPVQVALQGFGMFGGDRPRSFHAQVAASAALDHLQARVARACAMAGAEPPARRFVPHVTLGRFRAGMADAMRLERAVADGAGFAAGPWLADRFVLLQSHPGAEGPHYQELADYPLTG